MTKISELPETYSNSDDDRIIVNQQSNGSTDTYQAPVSSYLSSYFHDLSTVSEYTTYDSYDHILMYRNYHGPVKIDLDDLMSDYMSTNLSSYISDYVSDFLSEYLSDHISEYLSDPISEYLSTNMSDIASSVAGELNYNYPVSDLDDYISKYLDDHGGGGGGGDVSAAIESYFEEYPQYAVNDYLGSWVQDSPSALSDYMSEYMSYYFEYNLSEMYNIVSSCISENMSIYISMAYSDPNYISEMLNETYLSELCSKIYQYPNDQLDSYLSQYLSDHLSEFLN